MKAKLEFDLDNYDSDDRDNFKKCVRANDMVIALNDIWNQCFRPARKHGYDAQIEKLIDACGKDKKGYSNAYELLYALGEIYHEILSEHDLHEVTG